jgi:hypothetical protein
LFIRTIRAKIPFENGKIDIIGVKKLLGRKEESGKRY